MVSRRERVAVNAPGIPFPSSGEEATRCKAQDRSPSPWLRDSRFCVLLVRQQLREMLRNTKFWWTPLQQLQHLETV